MWDVSSKIPSLFWKQVSVQMILVTVLEGSFQALGSRSLIAIMHFCSGFIQIFGRKPTRKLGKISPMTKMFQLREEMPEPLLLMPKKHNSVGLTTWETQKKARLHPAKKLTAGTQKVNVWKSPFSKG